MKYFVMSDLHGSAYYTRKLLDIYKGGEYEKLLLLGDLLYHGPRNDLPKDYAPKEVLAMLNPLKDEILAVRGNCDAEVDQMVLDFPIMADYALLDLGGRSIFLSHGHVYNLSLKSRIGKSSERGQSEQLRDSYGRGIHDLYPRRGSAGDGGVLIRKSKSSMPCFINDDTWNKRGRFRGRLAPKMHYFYAKHSFMKIS